MAGSHAIRRLPGTVVKLIKTRGLGNTHMMGECCHETTRFSYQIPVFDPADFSCFQGVFNPGIKGPRVFTGGGGPAMEKYKGLYRARGHPGQERHKVHKPQ
jgi:hypothetical protein